MSKFKDRIRHRLWLRLGLADEYVRLSLVKCTGLGITTGTSKAVIYLELVATSMKLPLDKEYDFKLSGLNKKQYQSNLKSHLGVLNLQIFCQLLFLANVDLSKPLFTTAALNAACEPTSQKQQKEDSEECTTQDYEEWKPKNLGKCT
uniref:Origin recognition complex, subunit 6 n=1 Tax=Oncorhynchus kisutch TaxID=8019 RepID=A0A8C7F5S1_ONCKI